MKNYNFRPIFHNFNENFCKKCLEFLAKIWEKFRSIHLYGVRGAEPPEARDFIKKVQKSNGNLVFLKIFLIYQRKFEF